MINITELLYYWKLLNKIINQKLLNKNIQIKKFKQETVESFHDYNTQEYFDLGL